MVIEKIGVIGAGTMGHGIAHVAAQAGYTVKLYDVTLEAAEKGLSKIAGNLAKGVIAVLGTLAWMQNMLTAPIGIGWMYFAMLMSLAYYRWGGWRKAHMLEPATPPVHEVAVPAEVPATPPSPVADPAEAPEEAIDEAAGQPR